MAGNAVIGALRVSLGLDTAQFETGLKSAQSKLASFGKLAGAGLAVAGVAAAAAGVAIAASVTKSLNAFDELSKTSQKVGVPIEALGKLKYAGELADVSLDQLSTGLRKLSVNMLTTAKGGAGPAAEAFKTLGVSVTDAGGKLKGSDQVLSELADRFKALPDGAQKTALAVQLFGKSGADLIPLLNEGAAGLKAMGDEAAQLGLVIDEKTGKAAEQFNDNLTRLKAVGQGVTTQLAASLAPALADISEVFVGAAKNADFMKAVGQGLSVVLKTLASAVVVVGVAFANVSRGIAAFAKAVVQVFQGDFKGAFDTLKGNFVANLKGLGDAANSIKGIWIGSGKDVKAAAPKVSDELVAPITQAADKAKAAAKLLKDEAAEAARFIAAEQTKLARRGLDGDQARAVELQAEGSKFLAEGNRDAAESAHALAESYLILASVQKKEIDVVEDLVATLPKLGTAGASGLDALADRLQQVSDVFNDIGSSFDQLFYGLKNRDWISAAGGLVRAAQGIKAAFASGDPNSQAGAIAATGQAVGDAVGGKGGAAIAGAASGAAVGFTVGGPIGAAVGAIIGGIGGFLGAGSAKKKAKREAAERAEQERLRAAAEAAAQKRELEIRLLELSGDAAAAAAAREEDYIKSLSAGNQELARSVLTIEKENDAKAAAAALIAQQRDLEAELAEARGDTATATRLFREEALAALPEAFRAAKQQIFDTIDAVDALTRAEADHAQKVAAADDLVAGARSALADAADAEAGRLGDVADKFSEIARSLADFGRELRGGALAGLSARGRRGSALASFNALRGKTDEASLAALPEAGRALIEAARATSTSRKQVDAVIASVRKTVAAGEAAAAGRVSEAQAQLTALHTQTDLLIGIRQGILTVAEAMTGLSNALFNQQSAIAHQAQALYDLQATFDAAAASRVLDTAAGSAGLMVAAANDGAAPALEDLGAKLDQVIVNTGGMNRNIDDLVYGSVPITTVAAV